MAASSPRKIPPGSGAISFPLIRLCFPRESRSPPKKHKRWYLPNCSHGAPNVPPHLPTPPLPSAAAPLDTPVLSVLLLTLLLLASRLSPCRLGGLRKEEFSSSLPPPAAAAAAAGPPPAAADSLAPVVGTLQSSSPAAVWWGHRGIVGVHTAIWERGWGLDNTLVIHFFVWSGELVLRSAPSYCSVYCCGIRESLGTCSLLGKIFWGNLKE